MKRWEHSRPPGLASRANRLALGFLWAWLANFVLGRGPVLFLGVWVLVYAMLTTINSELARFRERGTCRY